MKGFVMETSVPTASNKPCSQEAVCLSLSIAIVEEIFFCCYRVLAAHKISKMENPSPQLNGPLYLNARERTAAAHLATLQLFLQIIVFFYCNSNANENNLSRPIWKWSKR